MLVHIPRCLDPLFRCTFCAEPGGAARQGPWHVMRAHSPTRDSPFLMLAWDPPLACAWGSGEWVPVGHRPRGAAAARGGI